MPKTYFILSQELRESDGDLAFPLALRTLTAVSGSSGNTKDTSPDQRISRFKEAVGAIFRIGRGEQIANKAGLDGYKYTVQRALEATDKHHAVDPYLARVRDQRRNPVEEEAYYKSLNSLIDCKHFVGKYAKHESVGGLVGARLEIAREFLPILVAYEAAKGMLKTGRVPDPNAKPKEVNPDKVVGTCGWCLRGQAILPNMRMVHHGYERPGHGLQTQSCPGISYLCLQVSDEGLKARLNATKNELIRTEKALERLPSVDSFTRHNYRGEKVVVKRGEIGFDGEYRSAQDNLKRGIESLKKEIEMLDKSIANWKAAPIATPKGRKSKA